MSRRKVTPRVYERIMELKDEGYKNTEIAKTLKEDGVDLSVATVRAYVVFGSSTEMDEHYARKRGFANFKEYNEDLAMRRALRIEEWMASLDEKEAEN
jgi:hypothetical protein|tara:strand:+ start:2299 stop:2592 length:294 start_codon:yes stop_codon:yes gene_type:complete